MHEDEQWEGAVEDGEEDEDADEGEEEVQDMDEVEVEAQALDLQLPEAELPMSQHQALFLKVLKEGGREKTLQISVTNTKRILAHQQLSPVMLPPLSFSADSLLTRFGTCW